MQSERVSEATATATEFEKKQGKLLWSERSAFQTWRANGSSKCSAEIFGEVCFYCQE